MGDSMKVYVKRIVARFSPQNRCFVEDGIPLLLKPASSSPSQFKRTQYFLSAKDFKTRSRYGWVEETEPFTISSFLQDTCPHLKTDPDQINALELLLDKVALFEEGKSVAVSYADRGIPPKKERVVHRVIFYPKD